MQAGLYARKMNKSIANSGASNALHIVEIGRLNSELYVTLPSISKIYEHFDSNFRMRDPRCKHEYFDKLSKGVTILKMKLTNIHKHEIVDTLYFKQISR